VVERTPRLVSVPDVARGLLVYDGACEFCTRCAGWIRSKWPTSDAPTATPWQELGTGGLASLGLTVEDVSRAAWWVEDGRRDGGHLAIARSLIAAGGGWGAIGHLLLVPPIRWTAAVGYRIVADRRGRFRLRA
jgi:predicted DCC family thiol-disulfide oxidoreductase YuxK